MATDPTALINYLATQVGPGIANSFQQGQNNALAQQQAVQGLQQGAIQTQALQAKMQRQQAFDGAAQAYLANPTPDRLAQLAVQFPEQADALKNAWKIKDDAAKQADMGFYASLYNAAKNGRQDLVQSTLRSRRDAMAKGGMDTSELDDALSTLGSTQDLKTALGNIQGISLAHIYAGDPDKFATAFGLGKDKGFKLSPGETQFDADGKPIASLAPKQETHYFTLKDANGVEHPFVVNGDGAPSSGGSGALSTRLNNPGAIRFDPKNQWQGQVGQQNGFVQFDTPTNGQRAHQTLIANQIRNGYDTPLAWAQHYAPASDGNDPQAYAATVAKGLGIGVKDKIPLSAVPKMAALSARVEAGGTPSPQGGGSSGLRQLDSTPFAQSASDAAPGDTSLSGDAYLASLPPSLAAQVKALSEGRLQIPTGAALRSPKVQQLWAAAAQYDPNLDQANAKTRAATRKEFTSGKAASNITSFNTVLHHIDNLQHAANDLNNWSFTPLNAIGNATNTMLGGASVKKFNAAKQAVVDELERAFRGTSGTLAGIKGWEDTLSSSSSPQQIQGVLNQMANLLAGRIDALGEQYTAGMGKSTDGINLLDSKARATLTRLADGYRQDRPEQQGGPTRVTSRAEAMALPSGTKFIDPNGILRVRP